jgi:prepilin-type N-terminal cleavage/methylation domain-containing protein
MHHSCRPVSSRSQALPRRRAFTLVELLVAIAIFTILATITLGAFRGVSKDDRISAGVQQVKGWFEHAKSLAIHAKEPRGIRFLPDQNNPRLCTSIVYIGQPGYDEGDLKNPVAANRKYVQIVKFDPNPMTGNPSKTTYFVTPTASATSTDWASLIDSGALSTAAVLRHGLRIEVPKGSGLWHSIVDVDTSSGAPALQLGSTVPLQFIGKPLDYRLEIGPAPLSDNVNPLPAGVVIDLDASIVPVDWRINSNTQSTNPLPWPYSDQMDIMFSPRGTFMGALSATQGVIHLCVSTQADADAARLISAPPNDHPANVDPVGSPARAIFPADLASLSIPFVLADPATTQKIVSIFLTSGRVSSSEFNVEGDSVDTTPANRQSTYSAAQLFGFALRGKEAK